MYLQQLLSQKKVKTNNIPHFIIGEALSLGLRASQEDYHFITQNDNYILCGLFDGHAGYQCADFCSKNLEKEFVKVNMNKEGMVQLLKNLNRSFYQHCLQTDSQDSGAIKSGSCATIFCYDKLNDMFLYANTGDSRQLHRDINLYSSTRDHKPNDPDEKERILLNGGTVQESVSVYRVNGNLSVARTVGDFDYKNMTTIDDDSQHIITCIPDVNEVMARNMIYSFMGCDGIFDVLSNEQVDYVIMQCLSAASMIDIDNYYFDVENDFGCVVKEAVGLYMTGNYSQAGDSLLSSKFKTMSDINDIMDNIHQGDSVPTYIAKIVSRVALYKGSTDNISCIVLIKDGDECSHCIDTFSHDSLSYDNYSESDYLLRLQYYERCERGMQDRRE